MTAAARRLLPALLPNLRDAGGLTTTEGRILRSGILLRSSALITLSAETRSALTELFGTGTYVDLRTDPELAPYGEPDALIADGWTWRRIPLQDRYPDESDEPADVLLRYRRALDRYLEIADEVSSVLGDRPVIVGCMLGKDRTGLLTAILLDRLGVRRSEIIEDFAFSNLSLGASRHLLPPRWHDPARAITQVSPEVCATVLNEIPASTPLPTETLFSPHSVRSSGADRAGSAAIDRRSLQ